MSAGTLLVAESTFLPAAQLGTSGTYSATVPLVNKHDLGPWLDLDEIILFQFNYLFELNNLNLFKSLNTCKVCVYNAFHQVWQDSKSYVILSNKIKFTAAKIWVFLQPGKYILLPKNIIFPWISSFEFIFFVKKHFYFFSPLCGWNYNIFP